MSGNSQPVVFYSLIVGPGIVRDTLEADCPFLIPIPYRDRENVLRFPTE